MKNMLTLDNIEKLINDNKLEETMAALDRIETTQKEEMVRIALLKGKIFQKQQRWGDLINQANIVLTIDPQNKAAKVAIDMANSILGFYNHDLLNP